MAETTSLRARLRDVVDGNQGSGRAFALTFQTLIILSLISFLFETEPGLSSATHEALRTFEVFTVAAFTLEYALRVYAAERRLRFVFSFWGLIDLLAIVPFYVGGAVDLRSIRVLRLLRLVRVLRLVRYGAAAARFRRAFESIRAEITLFLATCGILIYLVSVGIYYCERAVQPETFGSIGRCLWWAVVTLTAVGYGDAYPITTGGRLFTSVVLLIGLGVVAVPSGMVASALTRVASELKEPADHSKESPAGGTGAPERPRA